MTGTSFDDFVPCPECDALNPPGDRFCGDCGGPLREPAAPRRRRAQGAGAPRADRLERGQMNRDILRARKALKGVRGLLWFYAVVNLLGGLVNLRSEVPTIGWIGVAVGVVGLVGAVTIYRFPFGWTVGVAAFQTLHAVLVFLLGATLLAKGIHGAVTVALWAAVPITARASQILREHGGEFSRDRLKGRHRTTAGTSEARARAEERRREERAAFRRRMVLVAVGLVAVAAVGIGGYELATAPEDLDPRLREWSDAFESGNFAVAQTLCTDDYQDNWPKIQRILDREGWLDDGVALGEPRQERERPTYREIHFDLPRGLMKTKWVVDGRRWRVDGIILSGVRGR